jgi:hypothetical protein
MTEDKAKVTISAKAFIAILLHAQNHRTTSIHGVLVGSQSGNKVVVEHAFPICHETPTRPLLDAALALVDSELSGDDSNSIVGWFTSPEILGDEKAGPVAMRIAANLASDSMDPVLLVLNNVKLGKLVANDGVLASQCVRVFGKDFGKQWIDLLEVDVVEETNTTKKARELLDKGRTIKDLSDHWEEGHGSEWNHSANIVF